MLRLMRKSLRVMSATVTSTPTHISIENAKLAGMLENPNLPMEVTGIASWSLPAGYSCPEAQACLAKVIVTPEGKAKLIDGEDALFRCFEATMEAMRPSIRINNAENFAAVLACNNDIEAMADVLEAAINKGAPRLANLFRIHIGGDFYSANYLRAWFLVARRFPMMHFFAYTKSIRHLVSVGYFPNSGRNEAPSNINIVASYGGRNDALIGEYGMRSAQVVYSEAEAEALGLMIDHDDSLAAFGTESFALLIHGTQAKGTDASEALKLINREKKAAALAA
jgi:hypothetical protein